MKSLAKRHAMTVNIDGTMFSALQSLATDEALLVRVKPRRGPSSDLDKVAVSDMNKPRNAEVIRTYARYGLHD